MLPSLMNIKCDSTYQQCFWLSKLFQDHAVSHRWNINIFFLCTNVVGWVTDQLL